MEQNVILNGDEITPENNIVIKTDSVDNILSSIQQQLVPFDFGAAAEDDLEKKPLRYHYVVFTVELVLRVTKLLGYSLTYKNGQVYIFNGQFWKAIPQGVIEDFLGVAAEKLGVKFTKAKYHAFRTDLYKQFITSSFFNPIERNPDEVLINLKNGTFSITTKAQELRAFNKDDFMTYQLPFHHEPDAKFPAFKMFLDRVLPDPDQQKVLAEFLGYIFMKHRTLKLEKFLILLGDGGNGKSVVFDIVSALLGNENVSNYSLQSLTNDNGYFRASLVDKLVNYSSEISTQMNSTIFKQLVSGEKVEARLPYGRPFILEDYAKLMFNTNDLPRDVEQNHAYYRRFLILHFGVTIPDDERDPELAKKIIANELPGVFNWVLGGLKRLLAQKRFTDSHAMTDVLEQYKRDSDTVLSFLVDEGYEKDVQNEIKLSYLYQYYSSYCKRSGFKYGSTRLFSKRLKAQGFHVWRKNRGYVVDAKKIDYPEPSPRSLGALEQNE